MHLHTVYILISFLHFTALYSCCLYTPPAHYFTYVLLMRLLYAVNISGLHYCGSHARYLYLLHRLLLLLLPVLHCATFCDTYAFLPAVHAIPYMVHRLRFAALPCVLPFRLVLRICGLDTFLFGWHCLPRIPSLCRGRQHLCARHATIPRHHLTVR